MTFNKIKKIYIPLKKGVFRAPPLKDFKRDKMVSIYYIIYYYEITDLLIFCFFFL